MHFLVKVTVGNPWLAWQAGRDIRSLDRAVRQEHERFVTGVRDPGEPAGTRLRPVVRESWQRSVTGGFDPESGMPPVDLVDDALAAYRDGHPLASVMPLIRRLLGEPAVDGQHLVAVTDAEGRILWVEGDHQLRSRAENMHFVEGAIWDESRAGTNAPGTALALDHSVQIFASEHFSRIVQPWSCSAAPIHDPVSGTLLGTVDLTGGDHVASPHALALVGATVVAVEAELQLQRVSQAVRRANRIEPTRTRARRRVPRSQIDLIARVEVLGRDDALLVRANSAVHLSLRLAELLVVLAQHPEGLTGESLAIELYENEASSVTLRAEVSRLRRVLGEDAVSSRPYRLDLPLRTDVDEVRQALDRGSLRRAVDLYAGPLLPHSDAPGVVALREELRSELRGALLRSRNADVLLTWGESYDGRDDLEVWTAVLGALPVSSPRRDRVRARLTRLEADLGGGPGAGPGQVAATSLQRQRS